MGKADLVDEAEAEPSTGGSGVANSKGATPRCGVRGPRPDMHDVHEHVDEDAAMRSHVISLNRQLREKEALLAALSGCDADAPQR